MTLIIFTSLFILLLLKKSFFQSYNQMHIIVNYLLFYFLTVLFMSLSKDEAFIVCFFFLILFLSVLYLIVEEFTWRSIKLMGEIEIIYFIFLCFFSFSVILYCNNIYWSVFTLEIQSFLIFGTCALLKSNSLLKAIEGSLSYVIPGFFSFFLMLISIYVIETTGKEHILGNLLLLLAIMIKMGVIPFGLWVNNVIRSLSFNSIILLTFINKLSILLILVLYFSHLWYVLALCGIISLLFGSILMVNTPKTKEMLAYSSIINSGWLCLLIATFSNLTIDLESNKTILGLFYFIYVLGILLFIDTNKNKTPFLKDLNDNSLIKRNTIIDNTLTYAGLLSMSGMPPFTGFIVKYLILLQVISLYSLPVAGIIIAFSIIATFCYVRPIISYSTPRIFNQPRVFGALHLINISDIISLNYLVLVSVNIILLSTLIFIFI